MIRPALAPRSLNAANPRSGGILLMALLVVMTVTILAGTYLQLSTTITRRQSESVASKRAFYIAEAGLAEAWSGLRLGKTGNVGSEAEPALFGDGLFWVEATELPGDRVELECTGMGPGGEAMLSMVAERGEISVAALGVFATQELVIPPGTIIDGFDSSEGPYTPSDVALDAGSAPVDPGGIGGVLGLGVGGAPRDGLLGGGSGGLAQWKTTQVDTDHTETVDTNVGSNAGITVQSTAENPTAICGNLTCGVNDEVSLVGDPVVTGVVEPRLESMSLPPVNAPTVTMRTGLAPRGAMPLTIKAGRGAYQYLNLPSGSEAVIQGPVDLVLGSLSMAADSVLTLDTTGGPIKLYVTGAVNLDAGSVLSTTETDPTQVNMLLSTDGSVTLAAEAEYRGSVYAPLATVNLGATFELFGSVVADSLVLESGSRLHFDRVLTEAAADAALPTLLSWRIVELPRGLPGAHGMDPFKYLGINKASLLPPARMHQDQNLEVQYLDGGGALQSYTGQESAFDWQMVKKVVSGKRDGRAFEGMAKVGGASLASDLDDGSDGSEDLINAIAAGMTSTALRDLLLSYTPVDTHVISELLDTPGAMDPPDVRQVLEAQPALEDAVLLDMVVSPNLTSGDLRDLLVAKSPLPAHVVTEATRRTPPLTVGDLASVIGAQ